jgi:hypothetical protein
MVRKVQFGAAIVMIVVVVTSAPALLCVGYLGQRSLHDCCPGPSAPESSVLVCCVQSPAVTTPAVDVDHSAIAVAIALVAGEHNVTMLASFFPPVIPSAESSGSSPVLRI